MSYGGVLSKETIIIKLTLYGNTSSMSCFARTQPMAWILSMVNCRRVWLSSSERMVSVNRLSFLDRVGSDFVRSLEALLLSLT